MDSKVTVSVRGILVAGLAVLALTVAYLVGSAGGASTPANATQQPAQQQSATERRTVSLTGKGVATAVPDQLSFSLGVGVTRTDLDTALAEANTTMKRVLATLEDFGVTDEDLQTTGLSMNPVYDYSDNGSATIIGYRVSQRARVTVSDLGKGGKAITAAVNAGGNSVHAGNIRLEVSEPGVVLGKAREAAVQAATTKAEEYAEATSQELGDVLSLREVTAAAPRGPDYATRVQASDLGATKAVPIRAGEDELAVTVQVVWEFR